MSLACYPAVSTDLSFIREISRFREFRPSNTLSLKSGKQYSAFDNTGDVVVFNHLQLSGAQEFARYFMNPNTKVKRLCTNHQTGTGKSILAITTGNEFCRQYRRKHALDIEGGISPRVFVISFTYKDTIQEDMLKYPEFGFVSPSEISNLHDMRINAGNGVPGAAQLLHIQTGILRRRISDVNRGGYYQFYGYKEFATKLFTVTKKGLLKDFNVLSLYSREEGVFSDALHQAVMKGFLIIDENLIEQLRGAFIICDEIHNVYNMAEKNNYGIAIQYVLDTLGDEAPRALFMSATPITGAASEVVDLLNLLVPKDELPSGMALRRSDLFKKTTQIGLAEEDEVIEKTKYTVSELNDGALALISRLCSGRISFLLDATVELYPRRKFIGEGVEDIPYLKFTKCFISEFHKRTIDSIESNVIAVDAYALYDMAFPNPSNDQIGLYSSKDTVQLLSKAPQEWKDKYGVNVEAGLITGSFLNIENIRTYSEKMYQMLSTLFNIVKNDKGKIMIYHHNVRMSGVLLIQESLKENGFCDEFSEPTNSSICNICCVRLVDHGDGNTHEFQACRFVIAHSDIDRSIIIRSMSKFNEASNTMGNRFRIIVGSRIIKEGLNFKAIRHQIIMSLPSNFPIFIQIIGRCVRKGSHLLLPAELQTVDVYVLISLFATGQGTSYEQMRYIIKGKEYLVIQEVERALRVNSIDGYSNYSLIKTAIPDIDKATLESLPYRPAVEQASSPMTSITFDAYGYADREVSLCQALIRSLFNVRCVWKYNDLFDAVKNGMIVRGLDNLSDGNFALAISKSEKIVNDEAIRKFGEYYIMCKFEQNKPIIDIEHYYRTPDIQPRAVRVEDYLSKSKDGFDTRIDMFEKKFISKNEQSKYVCSSLALIKMSDVFHYTLLKRLIVGMVFSSAEIDECVVEMYKRFKIAVLVTDKAVALKVDVSSYPYGMCGFIAPEYGVAFIKQKWTSLTLIDLGQSKRQDENSILIGYVANPIANISALNVSESDASKYPEAKFKTRQPKQQLKGITGKHLARGSVCETNPRENINNYIMKLERVSSDVSGGNHHSSIHSSSHSSDRHDLIEGGKVEITITSLCDKLALLLLACEEQARKRSATDSIRWVYLFNERPPNL
jgi:hypothetical protein